MPTVAISPHAVCVGRLKGASATEPRVLYSCPAHVRHADTGSASGIHEDGTVRAGRQTNVPSDIHWVLEPLEGGTFQIRPVFSWYEFGQPMKRDEQTTNGLELDESCELITKDLDAAEAEIKHASRLRNEFEDKWQTMRSKHGLRCSLRATRAQITRRRQEIIVSETTADLIGSLDLLSKSPLEAVKTLQELEATPRMRRGNRASNRRAKIAHPEEDRLNDNTGMERHKQKARKALKRKAGAVEEAEEAEVPDTANALHQLKPERGEATWDFEDGEEFSDDEQEQVDVQEQLQDDHEHVADVEGPEIDVGEGLSDAEDGEEVDTLTVYGRELEQILEKQAQNSEEVAGAGSGQDEKRRDQAKRAQEPCRPVHERKREAAAPPRPAPKRSQSRPAARERKRGPKAKAVVVAAATGPAETTIAKAGLNQVPTATRAMVSSAPPFAVAAVPVPASAAITVATAESAPTATTETIATTAINATSAATVATVGTFQTEIANLGSVAHSAASSSAPVDVSGDLSDDDIRNKAIECLRKKGGTCKLSNIAAALGLRSPQSPLYKRVVAVLKEVADMERAPDEERPVLMLKLEFWGAEQGPPIPDTCRWCYLDGEGKQVANLCSARRFGTAGRDRLHVRIFGPSGRAESAWIPKSKAPERSPEIA